MSHVVPEAQPSRHTVATIPNLLSLVRLLCVPLFLWLLWSADRPIAAGWLLAALGATDWVDGYIARHFDQGSELGKILDPTADRALLIAGAVALLVDNVSTAVNIVVVVVLVREVLIGAVTVGLALAGARRIDVIWAGKAGTLAIMFALPLFIVTGHSEGFWYWFSTVTGWGFAIGGIGLGWYAAAKYVPQSRIALAEGRAARAAGTTTS